MAVREPAKPIEPNTLGVRLRLLRKEKGYTLTDVANLLDLKGPSLISNYETNYRKPGYETLQKLADFYGTSIQYLITGEELEITPDMLDLIEKIKNLSEKEQKLLHFVLGD